MLKLLNIPREQRHYFTVPFSPLSVLLGNRRLVELLTARDIEAKYRGSLLGIFWSVLTPLLLLAVYTFIFTTVFESRWRFAGGVDPQSEKGQYALILFIGLITFNFFSECVARAPTLMLENVSYIKKVVFPLEILIWVAISSAGTTLALSLCIFLIFYMSLIGLPPLSAVALPILWLPLFLMTAGITWFLSSLGVYLRDLRQFIGLITTMLMFLSPVFYPMNAVPPSFQFYMALNPLTPILEQSRECLFRGNFPDPYSVLVSFALSLTVAWLGLMWFMKTKKGFADVT